jgi:hypothetical protein
MGYQGSFPHSNTKNQSTPGIQVSNTAFSGNVVNAGTIAVSGISVTNSTFTKGAIIDSGYLTGGISVDDKSTITGATTAIQITGPTFTGGIDNSGTVVGGEFGIFVGGGTNNGAASVSTFSGGITNSGAISGGYSGIQIYDVVSFVGDIANIGTISATQDSGIYVDNNATFDGSIVNETGASISGGDSGIVVAYDTLFEGGVTNAGAITPDTNEKGIAVYQTADFTGSIVNTSKGSIAGANAHALPRSGISVEFVSLFGGGISNAGIITAGRFGILVGSSTGGAGHAANVSTFSGGITNSGTITGDFSGIVVGNINSFDGGISNVGEIIAGQKGIAVSQVADFTGSIVNSSKGSIGGRLNLGVGSSGISVESGSLFGGGITNAGTIKAGGTYGRGIDVTAYQTFQGSIVNETGAQISAPEFGITVGFDGTFGGGITNSGGIVNVSAAIEVDHVTSFAGAIVNANGATITASGVGIEVSQVGQFGTDESGGGIVNAGSISGATGITVGAETGNANTAGISTFAGGITNSNAISASYGAGIVVAAAAYSAALVTISAFSGGIINAAGGTITAGAAGIEVAGIAGGRFVSESGTGLTPATAQISNFSGGITNAGTISASGQGIFVGGTAYSYGEVTVATFSGDIVNSGAISVGGEGILVGGKVSFSPQGVSRTALFSTGVDVATFIGGITNNGVISAGGDAIVVGGLTANAGVAQFTGNIVNARASVGGAPVPGTGTITGDIDILIANDATFTGNIVNSTGASLVAKTGSAIEIGAKGGNIVIDYPTYTVVGTRLPVANFIGGITNNGTISFSEGSNPQAYVRAGIQVGTTSGVFAAPSTFSGGITNTGTISITTTAKTGVLAGIFVSGVSHFSGGISNSGTISAHSDRSGVSGSGIVLYNDGTVSGGITNSGAIDANFGIGVVGVATFDGDVVNAPNGTINAGVDGIAIVGPGFSGNDSTFLGSILNQGSITATGGVGINVSGMAQFGADNAAGNISNSGTITAATGIAVTAAITGGQQVVDTTMYGSIVDTGEILASKHGIWIDGGVTISSTHTAVSVTGPTFTGGIDNAGTLSAPINGIFVGGGAYTSNFSNFIANVTSFSGGITNSGDISAPHGVGIAVDGVTVGGGITNGGTISAPGGGIAVGGFATFGGGIVNASGGTITAPSIVDIDVASGSVFSGGIINSGKLSYAESGITVYQVATFLGGITNNSSGTIAGPDVGILAWDDKQFGAGGVTNSGAIRYVNAGIVAVGVQTFAGAIVNQSGATIDAMSIGIAASSIGQFGTNNPGGGIVNAGTISAGGTGIGLDNVRTFTGGITNTGTISGVTGIDIVNAHGVSIFDSGVIDGTGGTAIQFDPSVVPSPPDTFTLGPGYSITGNVVGGGSDIFQLGGSGTGSFNLGQIGGQYTGFGTFEVVGGTWSTTGTGSDWTVEGGTLEVGGSVSDTAVNAGGKLVVENGGIASDTTISGGVMEVVSGGSAGASVDFAGTGTLQVDGPNTPGILLPGTTVSGFTLGDTIDLPGIAYSTPNSAGVNASDQLQFTEGGATYEIQLAGDYTGQIFALAPDGNTPVAGTDITVTPCYCPGTLIRTPRGQKRVENLKIGEMVKTASGAARPIKWIGRRSYAGRFVMGRKDILPVCIKAGALADNVPRRDLWISPNHAMYLDGVLIEAKDLVNGASIVQPPSAETIEYFHVELETHDVIVAEGALSETFIDDDDRALFHNAHEYWRLYPAAANVAGPAQYCAPRLEDGYEVETARRRIALRAGLRAQDQAPRIGALRGYIDLIGPRCIAGWAQNVDHPEAPVCLDIFAGHKLIGQVLADHYREDLKCAGLGSGRHSFKFTPPVALIFAPAAVEVRRALDGEALKLSADAQRAIAVRPRSRPRAKVWRKRVA